MNEFEKEEQDNERAAVERRMRLENAINSPPARWLLREIIAAADPFSPYAPKNNGWDMYNAGARNVALNLVSEIVRNFGYRTLDRIMEDVI